MQNGEPEGVYAQGVHEVVCFQPEDVQQEVRKQFGSKPGKIRSFKLSKKPFGSNPKQHKRCLAMQS